MCVKSSASLDGRQVGASLAAEVAVNDAALHEVEAATLITTLPIFCPASTYR